MERMRLSKKNDLTDLTDEELALAAEEIKRRNAERDKLIQEREDYVRFKAFARCNKCHRALSEDVFKKSKECPYCGHESAELIEYE